MIDILRRLQRIALRRGQQEFERWHETWNPPYSLLGTAGVVGLMGAGLCLLCIMFATTILLWEIRHDPMFWMLVVIISFMYGAIPGLALGAASGLAQALVWTRRSRLAGIACVVGSAVVTGRLILLMVDMLQYDPEWRTNLLQMLFLFASPLLWGVVLLVKGIRLLTKTKSA